MALSIPVPNPGKSSSWTVRLNGGARCATWAVGVIAATGVVAWVAGLPHLGALGADFPPILPTGILVLLSATAALGTLGKPDCGRTLIVVWSAAGVIGASALLGLSQYTGSTSVNAEFTMFPLGYWVNATTSLGTATTYLLLAGAFVFAPCRRPRLQSWSRALALAVGGVALVALIGLTFRMAWFDAAVPSVGMAFPVALGLLAASFGLVLRQPSERMVRLLEQDSPGALIIHRLLPAGVAMPLLVGWAQAFGQRSGWFDIVAGEGTAAVLTILACTALILWTSTKLDEMYLHRRSAEKRAATEREWLEVTLANIDDAVLTADGAGRVEFINASATRLLGVKLTEAVGRPVEELVGLVNDERGALPCPLRQAFAERRPVHLDDEASLPLSDGRLRPVEVSATPIHDGGGSAVGGILVLRDASVRRARERAMRDACAELDRRVAERTIALERAGTALRESTALLQSFAATTPELIYAKDREGRVTMINPAALRAFGVSRAEVLGRDDLELFGNGIDTARIRESDHRVMDTGESVTVEQILNTCNGPRTFLVTKSPLRDEYGQILGLVGVATDITERKRAQQDLERLLMAEHRLRDEAERASRAKDEFLAIVSHELRSPLNALKGWSHVLAGTHNPDPVLVARATQAIKRNVEHQTRLIDDLLDTSRIINGKLELELHPTNLVEVVHSAIDLARPGADAKSIELRFTSDHPVVSADGDAGRLQQVVVNLLSNGIKFTPPGGRVDIDLRRVGDWVELEVSDTGVGIDADFLPHVFDRFSQADSSTTRRYSGLGIGLALVRHLVELHGGTVRVDSAGPDRGTTFTVRLPATARAAAAPRPDPAGHFQRANALTGIDVLVVDDEADAREVIELAVSHAGARVRSFDSGRALIAALRAAPPEDTPTVVLIDIAMPGEDGFSVLARLRATEGLPFIPAIAVTALTHLDRREFTDLGFQDCLGKPIEIVALVDAIAALAGRRQSAALAT